MRSARLSLVLVALAIIVSPVARGQSAAMPGMALGHGMPGMDDDPAFFHLLADQVEDRIAGGKHSFRYDGKAWYGTDTEKLWLKSEGRIEPGGRFEDGRHEILYDRAVSTFFDLQAGLRVDLDDDPVRAWAALGVQGLLPYFLEIQATAYAGDHGVAARIKASYDLLITQRLILQPEFEINLYGDSDRPRRIGAGLSDLDAGLRLRYELNRKFAPYVGITVQHFFGQTADLVRGSAESTEAVRLAVGVRAWF